MTTMTPEQQIEKTRRQRRGQVRREIVLPVFGGFVLLIAIVVIAVALPSRSHTSLVSNFLLTVLVLCPAVICVFPIYMLMVFAVFGMGRVNRAVYRPLSAVEGLTHRVKASSEGAADEIAARTINLSVHFAKIERTVLSLFDKKPTSPNEDK